MYISKNDLIKRLVLLTGKNRSEFITLTVKELSKVFVFKLNSLREEASNFSTSSAIPFNV